MKDRYNVKVPIYRSDLRTNEELEMLPKLPLFIYKHQ